MSVLLLVLRRVNFYYNVILKYSSSLVRMNLVVAI